MLEALALLLSSPTLIALMLAAVPLGLCFGVIPGLGGKVAIIAVLPLIFSMDQLAGCVFLISLHAVVHTGGAVPSILFGIPGTGPSTAIVMDGHALAKRGEAVRALTASSVASAVGGVLGALFLAALIPISLQLIKLLSYPEVFFLALFGVALAALLSGDALIKGLLTGCFGLAIACVGIDQIHGTERYTFGQLFLWDGVDLITAVLAIYALPEMIALARKSKTKGAAAPIRGGHQQILKGTVDIIRHRWLVLRSSALGALTGLVPGLGGDVAAWLCYGHAVQSSDQPERFGHGAIDGVIGPEAANNSKEGGALAPTLFLGLPGSSGMAILLIALVPLGLDPGPNFVTDRPDLLWLMVWALVLSNIVAAALVVVAAPALNRFSRADPHYIVPFVYLMALLSIYLSAHDWRFFVIAGGLGLLGYAFKELDWPRAPFVIGVILGPAAEDALIKSIGIWGWDFFMRPVSLILMVLLLVGAASLMRQLKRLAETHEMDPRDAR